MTTNFVLFALTILSFSFAHDLFDSGPVVFLPEDLTHLTLYGAGAKYQPSLCPTNITFTSRARLLSGFAENRLGIYPTDIEANGQKCHADDPDLAFDMFPIGEPQHYPPQWIFERATGVSSIPVDLNCGSTKFSIRYGYFNDVKVDTSSRQLDPSVVYFDFAVVPSSTPFSFCSYATRRTDGNRPIDYIPFPTHEAWDTILKQRSGTHEDEISSSPNAEDAALDEISPAPEHSETGTGTESETRLSTLFGTDTVRSFFFDLSSN